MTGNCIYCRRVTSGDEGTYHIFPESLHRNDLVLPAGTVCDPCNGYFGNKLEPHLLGYPVISLAIQLLSTPGKGGRPRQVVGGIESGKAQGADWWIRMRIDKPTISSTVGGGSQAVVQLQPCQGFDMKRFRRVLHRIGLDVLAHQKGAETALTAQFDLVRDYAKNPRPADMAWGIAHQVLESESIPVALRGTLFEEGPGKVVAIQIFHALFFVDLLNSGDLPTIAGSVGARHLAWRSMSCLQSRC